MLRDTKGPHIYRLGCFLTHRGPILSTLVPFLLPTPTLSHWFLKTEGVSTSPDGRDLPGTRLGGLDLVFAQLEKSAHLSLCTRPPRKPAEATGALGSVRNMGRP